MNDFHTPVLVKEVLENLRVKRGKRYIDATIGGGGHTGEILKRGGIVLGLDVDGDALAYVNENFKFHPDLIGTNFKLSLARGNFREIDKIALLKGFNKVSGILFDLGVSSHQLEVPTRGFSFQKECPLDMRMDQDLQVKALDLINGLTKGELYELFTKLGEEANARKLSNLIVSARKIKPIETTTDLARIIEKGSRNKAKSILEKSRVFQALRIAVNDELNSLRAALPKGVGLLEERGRILVISFHSLEDRIVKKSLIEFEKKRMGKIITKKPVIPDEEEIRQNIRSRSAKMRVFEKN